MAEEVKDESLEDVFKFFDKDGNGSIEKSELANGLRALGCNPTDAEIQAMIAEADDKLNPNGKLEYNEFCELVSTHRKTFDDERTALVRAFQTFDKNGDGQINKEELRQSLTNMGFGKLSNEEVDELFVEADIDNNGFIDFNELVRVIMNPL